MFYVLTLVGVFFPWHLQLAPPPDALAVQDVPPIYSSGEHGAGHAY